MTLQVFNPVDATEFVAFNSNDQQVAKQLLVDCVAEIKQFRADSMKVLEKGVDSPSEAAAAMLERLHLQRLNLKVKDYKAGVAILNATPSQQAAIVLQAMGSLVADRYNDNVSDLLGRELLKSLLRRKLVYDDTSIRQMLTCVQKDSVVYTSLPVLSILSNVERHVERKGMSKSIRNQLKKLMSTFKPDAYSSDERKIGLRIKELLDCPPAKSNLKLSSQSDPTQQLADHVETTSKSFDIETGEAWSNAMLVELGKLADESRNNWHQLLDHCTTAKSSKPTKKWLKQTRSLVDAIGQEQFILVICPTLAAIGKPGECQRFNYGGCVEYGEETQIHDTHADLVRGLAWATSCIDDETLIGLVGDAAEKCFQKIPDIGPRSPKVGNACLFALSSLASESAVAQLGRLRSRAKHVSTRKQIAKAFDRAATNAGMSEADLIELGVPKFGMTETGSFSESFGDFTAEVTLFANKKPLLVWIKSNGKPQKTVPAAVKSDYAEQLKALKKKLKDIEKLMPSVRHRIEQLFLNERKWSLVDFRKRFLDHPIVGIVARGLIWKLDVNGNQKLAFWNEEHFVDSNDQIVVNVEDQTTVCIWHPMRSTAEEVFQWRRWLESKQVCQPFKQAHREIYILTDAERETSLYSNRFASHIIRQHQFAALCSSRGWRYSLQGEWDSWNAPFIDLPQHGLRAEFIIEPIEELDVLTQAFVYTHLSTDQVRFLPLEDEALTSIQPVPLENVPELVLSEVLRDVDLLIGVTSIGNDPEIEQRLAGGGERFNYWQHYSFGALSQTANTRKQTLETVVPRLNIASQCSFEDNFLVVEGKLRSYKIHLGSGNILMSPNDQYLCIVQKRGSGTKRTDGIYLPFEGDNTMSLILSKAFMLVADDKIKDQTIVNQIRLDRG